ncbi:hypothetical protein [Nocardia sp. NPDC052566]|uniref:hypothetical protein n=1 Tax=Nocardia sp. NPDC052566 TaxID=3364330 RepID=UPI0037C87140
MTLELHDRLITSDITPETARHVHTAGGGHWMLSWLPDVALTHEQAVSGMILDETLSDPHLDDQVIAMEIAAFRAAGLGIDLAETLLRLYARILERDEQATYDPARMLEPPTIVPAA